MDVSAFVKPSGRVRSPKVTGPIDEEDSVFVELGVEEAISLAEQDLEQVDLSHAENVSDWVEQIATWFEQEPEVNVILQGLKDDYDAVKAGVTLEVSNGPVEGQNNRLKMLKRQMFGRAGLKLLEKRLILTSEQLRKQ